MIRTFWPRCDAPGAQALQGGEPGDRDDRGLLEAQPGGLADQFVLSRSGDRPGNAMGKPKSAVSGPGPPRWGEIWVENRHCPKPM